MFPKVEVSNDGENWKEIPFNTDSATTLIEVPSQITHDRGVLEQDVKALIDDFVAKYNYSFRISTIELITTIEKTKVAPIYGSTVNIKIEI